MNNLLAAIEHELQRKVTIEYDGRKLEGRTLIKNELHNKAVILIKEINHINNELHAKTNTRKQ